jgi:hypothetical protein
MLGKGPKGGDDLPGKFLWNLLIDMYLEDDVHPAMRSGAYTIHDHRIMSYDRRKEGPRPYNGANAHETHVHQSVATAQSGYDSIRPWNLFKRPATNVERMQSALAEAIKYGRSADESRKVVKQQVPKLVVIQGILPAH